MAGKLPAAAIAARRLGGWTQPHIKLTQLSSILFERDRRMVTGVCLKCCGSGHFARDCVAPSQDAMMMYNCGNCNAMIRLSDHGVHTTHVDHGARRLRDDAASQASEVQSQRPRLRTEASASQASAPSSLHEPLLCHDNSGSNSSILSLQEFYEVITHYL